MADAKVEGEEEERRQSWPRRLLAQKADLLRKARRRRRTLHLDELPLGYKIVKQALLFLTWATIGGCVEMVAPCLSDLKSIIGVNYRDITRAISGRDLGYLTGAVVGGVIYDRWGRNLSQLMMAVAISMLATITCLLPHAWDTTTLWAAFLGQGIAEGVINVVGQELCLKMWKEKAASPLHIQHLGFGVGSFIVPHIAQPFLGRPVPGQPDPNLIDPSTSHISAAYVLVAFVTVGVAGAFFLFFLMEESHGCKCCGQREEVPVMPVFGQRVTSDVYQAPTRDRFQCKVIPLLVLWYFLLIGGERAFGNFLGSFARSEAGMSIRDTDRLLTSYWASYSAGLFAGFLVADNVIKMRYLIVLETSVLVTSASVLYVFRTSPIALTILAQPLGFFWGPLFPGGFGWANEYFAVTGTTMTLLIVGGSCGGILTNLILGTAFDHWGAVSLLPIITSQAALLLAIALSLLSLSHRRKTRFEVEKEQGREESESEEEEGGSSRSARRPPCSEDGKSDASWPPVLEAGEAKEEAKEGGGDRV